MVFFFKQKVYVTQKKVSPGQTAVTAGVTISLSRRDHCLRSRYKDADSYIFLYRGMV